MSKPKLTNAAFSDDEWEKDADVRALARAHAVKKDPKRHKAAIHHAKKMVPEHAARMQESKAICDMAKKVK